MDVFVDTIDSSFSIELGFWDTVLTIKQKIEKSQGIPVSRQVIFFKGKVLQDHFDITQYEILQNSRLKLFLSPADNPNQNNDQVPQTEQPSSASSNPIEVFANITQTWPFMVGRNNDQVLQTEETQVSLNSVNELLGTQESAVMAEGKNDQVLHQTEQTLIPSYSVGETIYSQDSSVMVRSDYNVSESLRAIEEALGLEDNLPPVTVGSSSNTNQVKRPLDSDKGKAIIDIPDSPVKKKIKTSPMKMTVMVKFKETWSIPMEVNADDNVEELRKELVKMQERGELYLPQEKYFLLHNQFALTEDQSFQWNLVADGDTIEIVPEFITDDVSTSTTVRSVGH